MNLSAKAPVDHSQWLTISECAQASGVSLRTVKRWIENGEVETKKDGARRLVKLSKRGTQQRDTDKGTQNKSHVPLSLIPRSKVGTQDTKIGDTTGTHNGDTAQSHVPVVSPITNEREAELKDEIRFLRSLIEQRDRDAAELRKALNEALKIAPRQLPQGEPQMVVTQPMNAPQNSNDDLSTEELDALCRRVFEAGK